MQLIIEAIGFGIATGAVIALGAVGFSVQFGISNILNITYGALMTLSAYIGLILINRGVNAWAALALSAVAVGVVSVIYHRILLAPLVRRGTRAIAMIIVTVSAGTILQYVIVAIAGPSSQSYGEQSGQTFHFADLTLSFGQVAIIVLTAVLMFALHLLLTRTTLGKAMRATSSNRTLARSCGIATSRISDIAWFISGCLCGAAGVALAITTVSFDFSLGALFLIPMIAAAVLGGIGQPYGAMLGGLIIGVSSEVAAAVSNPNYKDVVAFVILIIVLLVRPRGLFGAAWSSRRLMEG
ncbi:MAG TPA: branched-chain amino acid ABC transporter permease [Candidatus Saccharimonadales bacterium]|nr:branched-chain amino acid ABC transporter permease [Candidatus Saccharimonadales bacterium]